MTRDDSEYQAFTDRMQKTTRFSTQEDLDAFNANNVVFYPEGFGYKVWFIVETVEQYLDLIQRCIVSSIHGRNVPWFINDWNGSESEWVEFAGAVDGRDPAWYMDDSCVAYDPNVEVIAYAVDYNQYFDQPYEVYKTTMFKFADGELRMPEHLVVQLPFIMTVTSVDTFDRCGSIKGNNINVAPLANIKPGVGFIM